MLQPGDQLVITSAGGGVYPEPSRGARHVTDTVQIHVNTILTARAFFQQQENVR